MKLLQYEYLSSKNKNKNQSLLLDDGEIIHILVNKRPQTEKIFVCKKDSLVELSRKEYLNLVKQDRTKLKTNFH